ncbi:hypothetical protein L1987_14919 [Smallanthus sonchifolius]|uniref:Uncharacterized protein n=1 Tax=Smallanthus sonchifolius TaxID=185202 RepID=A0ACB9J4I8_9ASTR|nr:hypothetical protein L1987_14919 [Smallanthus sonchifolius]
MNFAIFSMQLLHPAIFYSIKNELISRPKSLQFPLLPKPYRARILNCTIPNPLCQETQHENDYTTNKSSISISKSQIDNIAGEEPELSNRYIRWLREVGNVDKAMDFLSKMEALGFHLSYVSYTGLLTALASVGRTSEVKAVFQEMVSSGFKPRQKVYNILLKGFLRRGLLKAANRVLESMNDLGVWKNRETYEILLDYYVGAGRLNDSWEVVAETRKDGFEPNSFVYRRIIELYRDNGMWKKATKLVAEIREN